MAYYPRQQLAGQDVAEWVAAELLAISRELQSLQMPLIWLAPQTVEPAKPRNGYVAYADGINWNPGGTGAGLYLYNGSVWERL